MGDVWSLLPGYVRFTIIVCGAMIIIGILAGILGWENDRGSNRTWSEDRQIERALGDEGASQRQIDDAMGN